MTTCTATTLQSMDIFFEWTTYSVHGSILSWDCARSVEEIHGLLQVGFLVDHVYQACDTYSGNREMDYDFKTISFHMGNIGDYRRWRKTKCNLIFVS